MGVVWECRESESGSGSGTSGTFTGVPREWQFGADNVSDGADSAADRGLGVSANYLGVSAKVSWSLWGGTVRDDDDGVPWEAVVRCDACW